MIIKSLLQMFLIRVILIFSLIGLISLIPASIIGYFFGVHAGVILQIFTMAWVYYLVKKQIAKRKIFNCKCGMKICTLFIGSPKNPKDDKCLFYGKDIEEVKKCPNCGQELYPQWVEYINDEESCLDGDCKQ